MDRRDLTRPSWRLARLIIGVHLIVASFIFMIAISLAYPDMTTTRLFLTFWDTYLVLCFASALGFLLARR